jgi:toxin ParE1/3/4
MKVVVTDEAWVDLLKIAREIAKDNPSRANSFLSELYDRCLQLGDMPKAYPLLPSKEQAGIRRRPYGN